MSCSWADPHFAGLFAAREDVRLADRAIDRLDELVRRGEWAPEPDFGRLRLVPPPYPPRHT